MAENLSLKKSPVECVLECPLCLHQLKLSQTLQKCLHSYCKSCLDKVPQKTQDGRQGWRCPMCDNFTKCDQIQQNTFMEELQKIYVDPHCEKIKCEQCSDDCGPATWKCAECKIGLCEHGKAVHLRIPMLKGHQIIPLDSDGEKVIDNIVFCKVHADIPAQFNCRDCEQLMCYKCTTTDHQEHRPETVEQALKRILTETESSVRKVNGNISILEAQIEGVKTRIEQTKESYASLRMKMDEHLETVISRMRAMKAQMEEDVNEHESIALDTLAELKQQIEKQLSQARIISNLTTVVTTKTKHTSQLQQLQTGLFEKVTALSALEIQKPHFHLPELEFMEGHQIKEELENLFGSLCIYLKGNNISSSGKVSVDKDNNFMCHDFEEIVHCSLVKSLEIYTESKWCGRLSHIDGQLWLPSDSIGGNIIQIYNEDGELEKHIQTGKKKVTVVRKAYNGDLLCGSSNGMYTTNKDFAEWKVVTIGQFSDVVVDSQRFFALECGNSAYIHQYRLTSGSQWKCIHKHKLVANTMKDFKIDENSTLCFSGDHFWVTSAVNKEVYKFNNSGKYLQIWKKEKADPAICGVDEKGKALIADFGHGKFLLLYVNQKPEIAMKDIWQSIKSEKVLDAAFDRNNDLWTLNDSDNELRLMKYSQNI